MKLMKTEHSKIVFKYEFSEIQQRVSTELITV